MPAKKKAVKKAIKSSKAGQKPKACEVLSLPELKGLKKVWMQEVALHYAMTGMSLCESVRQALPHLNLSRSAVASRAHVCAHNDAFNNVVKAIQEHKWLERAEFNDIAKKAATEAINDLQEQSSRLKADIARLRKEKAAPSVIMRYEDALHTVANSITRNLSAKTLADNTADKGDRLTPADIRALLEGTKPADTDEPSGESDE